MSIRVENLVHIYDKGMPSEQLALDNISFTADDGQLVGIIGHTGSGKSTLLQHLNGLLKPESGSIVIGDTDITQPGISMVQIRKKIGLVFQYPEYQLFEETVAKDVAFGPGNLGLSREEIDERVREAIELVGLDYEEIKDRSPFELSGGQKRRVAIAGVVAMRPDCLILDEATAMLDPRGREQVMQTIHYLNRNMGITVVSITHYMEEAAQADRVLVMSKGYVVMEGTPKEVFSQTEKVRSLHLDVPQAAELRDELVKAGIPMPEGIIDTGECAQALYELLQ